MRRKNRAEMLVAVGAVIVFTALSLSVSTAQGRVRTWPDVRSLEQAFTISDPSKAVVRTLVRDQKNAPIYLFVCRTGDDESVANVNYAGDLDCRLMPAELGEVEQNLLVEAPNLAAWYSRGRMFASELEGDCARYPEYGRVRNFRLRGLHLVMTFEDVVFSVARADGGPRLASYTLQVRVVRDPTAQRSIAESSGYLDPARKVPSDPRSCSVVRRGKEW
ncbi:MAG TPA: hypothetical protein VM166_01575 [Gemmatimonadaceae bacterium]|nr:hypothetical protein [Gemmatimonadaceae bacterium]